MKLSSPSLSAPLDGPGFRAVCRRHVCTDPSRPAAARRRTTVITMRSPAPTNLKVLPKTMTGEQVHDLMHKWEASLGAECSTCHAADPNNIGPNGKAAAEFCR